MDLTPYMTLALEEARTSLREGNKGFGAVIVKDDAVIAAAHDLEVTEQDPTSHAEMNAIRAACKKLGKNLNGCQIVSTHEPCPMCATAIAWSGISAVAYGYSIKEALTQGRKRIDLTCRELFERAGAEISIEEGVLNSECAVLYREDVRSEIKRLRNANDESLRELNADSIRRRTQWFKEHQGSIAVDPQDLLNSGYHLLLERFHITEKEAPVIQKTEREIVFHSLNFCPTLEACKILGLDTRYVCKRLNESSTDHLLKLLDSRLSFTRNYDCLRPYTEYCEEMVRLSDG
jgi:tRNA(adenine34) deaminase